MHFGRLVGSASRQPDIAPMTTGSTSVRGYRPQITWATLAVCMLPLRRQLAHVPPRASPSKSKSGEPITDQQQQMERWVGNYLDPYATQNVVSDMALNAIPGLPVLDELDTEPTEEELSKVIDCLSIAVTATVTQVSLCSVLWAKSLPESSYPVYRFWWLVSTQGHSVGSEPEGPPSTWCSLYDNYRRNAVNRTQAPIPCLDRSDEGI